MSRTFVLCSYFQSSCSWRVRCALLMKNLTFETRPINLLQGEQSSEEYLSLNPSGKVPTLIVKEEGQDISERYLTQSLAILEYLEELYPSPALLPQDPLDRQKVRELCLMIVADTQPLQNLAVLRQLVALTGNETTKTDWAAKCITAGFTALEQTLKSCSGLYCFGDEVTFADLCLVPQIYNAARFNVSMDSFPLIQKIYDRLIQLPAFKASHPFNQPDTPEHLRAK